MRAPDTLSVFAAQLAMRIATRTLSYHGVLAYVPGSLPDDLPPPLKERRNHHSHAAPSAGQAESRARQTADADVSHHRDRADEEGAAPRGAASKPKDWSALVSCFH